MCGYRSLVCFLLVLCSAGLGAAKGSKNGTKSSPWLTLAGDQPLVVARGGFSGLIADSSEAAYQLAGGVSLPNVIFWCDVQLTKDAAGICSPSLGLENNSDINIVFKNRQNNYTVNGVPMQGWFSNDFTLDELANVNLIQGIYSRPNRFDGRQIPILTVDQVAMLKPPGLWLNIQHDAFFTQHNLSMRRFVVSTFKTVIVNYISSPEVNFLRSIIARKSNKTKLIFRFLGPDEIEPSLNRTYGSLLSNLTFIKTFASGILVPKTYIWPVDKDLYLLPHTSLVTDAHKAGLEIFGADFANDAAFAYDFSYDPVEEYLSFIDNGNFSVDGVISDFPVTASEAIGCFSHIGKNVTGQDLLVISNEGSSGDYPGCTNLAYEKAISSGVDIIDCPVQITNDGVLICLGSINLNDRTNAIQSPFVNSTQTISELGIANGIFTFNLTWSQIQSLKPEIINPYFAEYQLLRNPKFKDAGSFVTLSQFLDLANNATSVSGMLISIEDAAYLAQNQGLGVTDAVFDTLKDFTTNKKIMIQSTNSSVLTKFKQESKYDLIYKVDENIRDADNATITEIKTFASSVVVSKDSVLPVNQLYSTGMTDIVAKLHAFKLPVYVQLFRNEFVSQAWDYYSDINEEINQFFQLAEINGVVTDFPGTAAKFKRNKCLGLGSETPQYALPVQPGGLFQLMTPGFFPPAEAPYPILTEDDVAEPPLPPVLRKPASTTPPPTSPPSGQSELSMHGVVSFFAIFLATMALI